MKLAERVRMARCKAGLSQEALATHVGVGRSAVANWEAAKGSHPSTAHLLCIAQKVGVAFEWLATGRGEMWLPNYVQDVPAAQSLLVEDADELQLLLTYRHGPSKIQLILRELSELQVAKPPPTAAAEDLALNRRAA